MGETNLQPIALYMIERHPLESPDGDSRFRWIGKQEDIQGELHDLIGEHDPEQVSVLVDSTPAGPAWERLLGALLDGQIRMVITHLAPLSSAQRQQLIGICAQTGAQLITPSDAGRNRENE